MPNRHSLVESPENNGQLVKEGEKLSNVLLLMVQN